MQDKQLRYGFPRSLIVRVFYLFLVVTSLICAAMTSTGASFQGLTLNNRRLKADGEDTLALLALRFLFTPVRRGTCT